jgi:hypothetical protein
MQALRIALAGTALLASAVAPAETPAPGTMTTPAAETGAPTIAAPAKDLSYTDDYRISVNHDADSDGEVVFRVTPKGGAPMEVKVIISKGTSENGVARAIKKAFVDQLGTKNQNIEMEDGENVIIERSLGAKDISLLLVSSTVKGLSVKVHRD